MTCSCRRRHKRVLRHTYGGPFMRTGSDLSGLQALIHGVGLKETAGVYLRHARA